jgi:hypothetical protein
MRFLAKNRDLFWGYGGGSIWENKNIKEGKQDGGDKGSIRKGAHV